jgi:hypothetical protein
VSDQRSGRDGDDPDSGHATADLVASSADDLRAGERLRQSLGRTGAGAWVGRHRVTLGGLAALVVVVVAGAAYLTSRPPPPNPVVSITVVEFPDISGQAAGDIDEQGRPHFTQPYQVTGGATGDVDRMVGVVGPGLRHPTSSIDTVTLGRPGVGRLGATVSCSDSSWWNAKDADYRARVRRTDTHGRVTTYDARLGTSQFGPSNAAWHARVQATCLRSFSRTMPRATASITAVADQQHADVHGRRQVDVLLTVTNSSKHTLWVTPLRDYSDVFDVSSGPWTALTPVGRSAVSESLLVDCQRGEPQLPPALLPSDDTTTDRGLPVRLSEKSKPSTSDGVAVWLRLIPASADRLDSQLAAMCSTNG